MWWHYPSASCNEPDRIARLNIDDYTWTPDTLERTAAEYPSIITQTPYLINSSNNVYLHVDDAGSALTWQLTTKRFFGGTDTIQHAAFIPDYTLNGDATATLTTYTYPQSSTKQSKSYTINSSSERVATEQNGRYWKYDITGSVIGQNIQFGNWFDEIQISSRK